MLKSKMALTLLVLTMLFSSCSKLPIFKSQKLNASAANEFENIAANNFDKNNNIHYGVAHNDTNFFVKVVFHEQESLMKIMRGGALLYFDPNGKKGKDYALKIERAERESLDRSAVMQQRQGDRENRMPNMPVMLNSVLTKVTWNANGKTAVFYRGIQKYKFDIEFAPNELNEVQLLAKLPLNELPVTDSKLMSIGISSGSANANSGNRQGGNSMQQGGGRSGGPGGGSRGGGMGSGGPGGGGQGGGRPMGSSSSSPNMSPIQIWFQVEL